jgi:hypothetical protein
MLMNEKISTVILRCSPPLGGEPRRIGHKRHFNPQPSFETPRKMRGSSG